MHRNNYDSDVTIWSPVGRLFQVEYAMEAVKLGSCCLGLKSNTHGVLAAFKRSPHELASYQKKIHKIDDHIGISIAGLNADARKLAKYMRVECLNYKFQFDSPMITGRLVNDLADKHQARTQSSWGRPYGVGLLVIGYDRDGPHLYQTCPSGNLYEYKAMAIGSRSQSARTYLEKHMNSFPDADIDTMILHSLKALVGPANDKALSTENTSVAIVGKDQEFKILEGDELKKYIAKIDQKHMETDD